MDNEIKYLWQVTIRIGEKKPIRGYVKSIAKTKTEFMSKAVQQKFLEIELLDGEEVTIITKNVDIFRLEFCGEIQLREDVETHIGVR